MDKRLLFASDDERIARAWIKNLLDLVQCSGDIGVEDVDSNQPHGPHHQDSNKDLHLNYRNCSSRGDYNAHDDVGDESEEDDGVGEEEEGM